MCVAYGISFMHSFKTIPYKLLLPDEDLVSIFKQGFSALFIQLDLKIKANYMQG